MIPSAVDYFPAGNLPAGSDVLRHPRTESPASSSGTIVRKTQQSSDSAQIAQRLPHPRVEALRMLSLALSRQIAALGELTASADPAGFKLTEEVRHFEADMIRIALVQTGGGQRRAARLLGMKITTLHRKIKQYKIDIAEVKNEAELLHTTAK